MGDKNMTATNDAMDVAAALRTLSAPDPQARCDAAVALGEAWIASVEGLPDNEALLDELARADAAHPGVADAFYETVKFNLGWHGDFGRDFKPWMLGVLKARRENRELDTPVPGNDLEFHAHEVFDSDGLALASLLEWGYVEVVSLALDHLALPPRHAIPLMTALFNDHGQAWCGPALALHFGELLEPVIASWPKMKLGTINVVTHASDYAYRRLWTATWIFPRPPAPASALPLHDPAALVRLLAAAGVPIGEQEAVLDHAQIDHIPVPKFSGSERHRYAPRPDLVLDVVIAKTPSTLNALRLVRARVPLDPPARGGANQDPPSSRGR